MSAQTTVAFGELLKEYRLAAGLTQESLAERAGVSARNIQNLERGENRPLKDTARRLAEGLALAERDRALLLTAVIPVPRQRTTPAPLATDQPVAQPPAEPEAPLPAGMLAVLVADVRGYTAFTHAHGDAAGARLATRFAALAGEAVADQGGRLVEVRGDEVLAVFTSARAALHAATGLLARCAGAATPELPLRAGVGLDVGEPVAVPGGYRGEVINTAARLCAQAGPGEVLASDPAVALARRIEGLAYEERGEMALKGISRPVRAWLVRAGDAVPQATAAPGPLAAPASAPAGPRHNLPLALSSFIGRDQEQARVRDVLASRRLVTLVGSGGVGKTRLALAVAAGLLDAYPDGVWLVELAPLADAALVPGAVAAALGLREEPGRSLAQTMTEHLQGKRLLLVLDNCEHLVTACAELASALLRACPRLRILATSREALGLAGEQRSRIPSLSVPDPQHLPAPELVGSYEAVRLFVERAQERRDGFALGETNARAVAEICARLDGVPLAIELAAARVGSLPVGAIAARLDDRFQLLTGGARDLPTRQRTLRAALDWSWELLDAQDRSLLARLAVFAGGWTLAAAESVCAGESLEPWAVLDGLDSLVGKSLVQVEETGEEAGRYRLLETVRQYATEHLETRGEAAATRDRHLAWCLALAEEAEGQLKRPGQREWLDRLEREHDNLRAALGWASECAAEEALRLASALVRFWELHGHLREGHSWLAAALGAGGRGMPAARARALQASSLLAFRLGDYGQATAVLEEALMLWRALADRRGLANSLNNLGLVVKDQGDYARATALHEEALALRRELGDKQGIAYSLFNLANVAERRGAYQQTMAWYEEALVLLREVGDRWAIATVLQSHGSVVGRLGDSVRAAVLFEESLALMRELGFRQGVALALNGLGNLAFQQGDYARAESLCSEGLALLREVGEKHAAAETLNGLGTMAVRRGACAQGVALHEEALALQREVGDTRGIANSLHGLGSAAYRQGDHARAVVLLAESLALSREIGARDIVVNGLEDLARMAVALGQPSRAARVGGAAEALRETLGLPLSPAERTDHDQAASAIRVALGEEAFNVDWSGGRALPLEEAIALALEHGPTVP